MAEGFTFGGGPLAEKKYLGDWLKWEQEGYYSRGEQTIGVGVVADTEYPSGTLLESDAGTGTKLWDGTGALLGILRNPVRVRPGETVPVSMIVRDAIVDIRGISYTLGGAITEAAAITAILLLPGLIISKKG